jgi:hypothetical protein
VQRLLPSPLTTSAHAPPVVVAAFAVITAITLARSLAHVFLADGGAQSIATIPLDTFPPAAADAVVFVFALWGLSQGLLGLVYLVVLLRYRALIPLMLVLVVIEYASRIALGHAKPIATIGTAPGELLNSLMIPVALLLLAVWYVRSGTPTRERPRASS